MKGKLEHGAAIIEFSLSLMFWISLLLGTLVYGSELVRALQATQVARDTGHMYARGVDFSDSNPNAHKQDVVIRLGRELNLQPTNADPPGDGVVILTRVMFVSDAECAALPPMTTCSNRNKWVATQRIAFGNLGLRTSNYTLDPLPSSDLNTDGTVKGTLHLTDTRLQLRNFNLLPSPTVVTDGFEAGHSAYMVEVYFRSVPFPGFTSNNGIYVNTIF